MSSSNIQNANELSLDNTKKNEGSNQHLEASTKTQLASSDTQQSTVDASSNPEQQKNTTHNSDETHKNLNQVDFEKKLQQYKSQYKNQKSSINNGTTNQNNNVDEQQKVPSKEFINTELKDQSNQTQKNNQASSEINKEEEQGLRQKLIKEDADNRLNQIQNNKDHQQIDLDTLPQSTNNNNFLNISQEIQIQDLQEKRQQQLVGINISPNSKVTINRELSNSYFGDHDQDDRSIYHEQEKLYSPTLDKQKTTQSKNESELNITSSPKQNKKMNESNHKQVSEFEASSPKIIKNEIIGDNDTDKKIQSQSNLAHTPTSSAIKDKDNNIFQGRDNFKKLSLKMNQVPLDEEFKNQQQQVQAQQNNINDQSSQPKQTQKRKKSEEEKAQQKKDIQNKKQQKENQQQEEGQLEEEYEEEEDEEDEEDDDEAEELEEEEENIKNNQGVLKNEEENNQKSTQNNMLNGNQKASYNNKDQVQNNELIENGNLNYLSSEQDYEDLYKINYKKVEEKPSYEQEIRVMQHDKQIYLRVSNIQEGIVTLISDDYSSVKMPLIFLPNDISCGSIVKLSIDREYDPEEEMKQSVVDIQQSILTDPNYFL
ncbi:hypothetical protein TTHERM_00381080 (macronuclear) [Tetrahymena thermophila SB210]|uniref:Uncharacterized protein n=1 Tax=Tetrahymena thermophila (strain SB210) TaxID=312017 RepID=Q23FA7_TETTS|nr:hypothetical protein TTHERM_00381080 [Tetrahymena thermophila SB210]EAR95246.2 hypothetical protein TTHERM_00381080 [Tetrahymena thermophila SB210]|eukprot:XP_001015491.2 hypothetical protein TTHERM_00381080 [Tetrahymena thermophila SB210]